MKHLSTPMPGMPGRPIQGTRPARATLALLLAGTALLGACATPQPVVYRPVAPSAVDAQRIAKDTQACRALAERRVGINAMRAPAATPGSVAQSGGTDVARAGVIGFVGVAANGLVQGSREIWSRARGAAAAGVAGMAAKTALEWNDPDKVFTEFVERCMDERGHDVLGWR